MSSSPINDKKFIYYRSDIYNVPTPTSYSNIWLYNRHKRDESLYEKLPKLYMYHVDKVYCISMQQSFNELNKTCCMYIVHCTVECVGIIPK